ncbi:MULTISPECIES: DUF2835 domain-containing protein [Halomonadaceae]|uniref:DUF2835 domain-containing protein n=1 Tax=Halomonadaceae TaxID=28256 RepID=UPI00159ABC11|nr:MULTISPECIES: DUF2835 domain-containing protein [Halomonas]QJQ94071.1 DUF2835 domain-containing protein [Halomonas sp. PA5]
MPSIDVVLHLTSDECLAHYQGRAQQVHALSVDGRRLVFPATALRHIVSHDGVHGVFRLSFNEQGKFESLAPLPRK